jgi:hypothetical protein
MARAVIDGRGLLAVHLNNIKHHQNQCTHPLGLNPLAMLGVGRARLDPFSAPRYYLFEFVRSVVTGAYGWHRYQDYTDPVKLPPWLIDPQPGYVTPLSYNASAYDYITNDGHKNIGAWIDRAAQSVGR